VARIVCAGDSQGGNEFGTSTSRRRWSTEIWWRDAEPPLVRRCEVAI